MQNWCTICNNKFIMTKEWRFIENKDDMNDHKSECQKCDEKTRFECIKILQDLWNDINWENKELFIRNKRRWKNKFRKLNNNKNE